jgi:hypothetical protein
MDRAARELDRQGLDLSGEALAHALAARLRSGERVRIKEGHLVGGEGLARVLAYLLESSGQREIEVLRASEIAPGRHGKWIRAFRDLREGKELRSWIWVTRWAELLGFDSELLALATSVVSPSGRKGAPARPVESHYGVPIGRRRGRPS